MKHLLIVDDDVGSRESLRAIFTVTHKVSLASGAQEAANILSNRKIDTVLLDVMMPNQNGLTFLKDVQSGYPDLPVVMVSAGTSVRPVVEAMRCGAYDFVTKPFDVEEIRRAVHRAEESITLRRRVTILESEVSREFPVDDIVGQSQTFLKALENARMATLADSTVLICGESGTGKELVARYIHAVSARREDPFVAVHCAALPESLMESELFGHENGAFTHADRRKPGRFDLAGNGTLFFDEVGEMSQATQVKLLRVLQEREFMRVGGTQAVRTDARIVAASARDLRAEVTANRFRDDLFYRLSVVPIHLAPLRERPEDIPLLARHFLDYYSKRIDIEVRDFAPQTMELLCRYAWPGNVRELRNVVERTLVLHARNEIIRPDFLPEEFHAKRSKPIEGVRPRKLAEAVGQYEQQLIESALQEANGVQTRAARLLGTTRRILKYRMEKLNIASERPQQTSAS